MFTSSSSSSCTLLLIPHSSSSSSRLHIPSRDGFRFNSKKPGRAPPCDLLQLVEVVTSAGDVLQQRGEKVNLT